ncbi:hypothetical protein RSA42_14955 [Exiguobacterium indicum]|nr:hypothetical protein RSA42_14955 [Exiguobacterium indicum]
MTKAIRLRPKHPLANYRLGYILYVNRQYAEAIRHFSRALDGTVDAALSDIQTTLTHMFVVNCSIYLARESLAELEYREHEEHPGEAARLNKYRNELLVEDEHLFDRLYYRKIQDGTETLINERSFQEYQADDQEIVLRSSSEGTFVEWRNQTILLNPNGFLTLFMILTNTTSTYPTLAERLTELGGQAMTYDHVRQLLRRLRNDLPFFQDVIQSTSIRTNDGTRMSSFSVTDDVKVTVLCRADHLLM